MYPQYPYHSYETKSQKTPVSFPPQTQDRQPGFEHLMDPKPIYDRTDYQGSGKLKGKTAIVTGGDSGIGRAVSVAFAKEGANVAVCYLDEEQDAAETKQYIESLGGNCITIAADLRNPEASRQITEKTLKQYGGVQILVNNCAVQFPQQSILAITDQQLENTFQTNIFSYFYLTRAVLPHLQKGDCIINTTSVTAYKGNESLIDYSATKGAIVAFTRSLSLSLQKDGIRVNAVAPGPVWTPLQPASFDAKTVSGLGVSTPMMRAGQPFELAPSYVYLASEDSGYVSGQVLHVNGGDMTGS